MSFASSKPKLLVFRDGIAFGTSIQFHIAIPIRYDRIESPILQSNRSVTRLPSSAQSYVACRKQPCLGSNSYRVNKKKKKTKNEEREEKKNLCEIFHFIIVQIVDGERTVSIYRFTPSHRTRTHTFMGQRQYIYNENTVLCAPRDRDWVLRVTSNRKYGSSTQQHVQSVSRVHASINNITYTHMNGTAPIPVRVASIETFSSGCL